ncbi:CheR family methyltransferase [Actinomadura barringtoniae]|uniref:CheR family methyltransferase n=1 Tax=Actinomadura barringtoniae TaxID=1427535 RepID=UPI0027DE73A0|nr:CheR family methyltransferase [Actinomadura barringtoniae]
MADNAATGDENGQEFEDLLLMLKETRGFDFTGYKPTTLTRRIKRRMDALELRTVEEYRDFLELEPEEFARLFDSLLINVTSFFRDPPAWRALKETVLPELLAAKDPSRPIRVWSAGCATGEEAYTLAILLAEELGADEFRDRVKIYATDLDEDALHQARTGSYTERQVAEVPEELRRTYFEPAGPRYAFRRDLRRQVIFGRNDLTHDAPISRVDLLVARNTLMYFNAETQTGVIRRFHFALSNPGYLFLGKAEMLLNHGDRFEPLDLRKRLFRKIPSVPPSGFPYKAWDEGATPRLTTSKLEQAALNAGSVAQIAVDFEGRLAVVNARAEMLFNLRPRDLGRPFQDLEVSYRPVELRSVIERVKKDGRAVELHDIVWHRAAGSEPSVYDLQAVPLFAQPGEMAGVAISFSDVTHYRRLRDELEHSNQELERAYEELQSLNEELETTNEELQSTNEELETTNEELQSTNEELETMNEELQSTNDELQEINDALRIRSEELDSANSFLGSVLRSLGSAAVVVDRDLRVQVWNKGSEELWGMRAEETQGRELLSLDIGLPLAELEPPLRMLLAETSLNGTGVAVDAVNRRGRSVRLTVEFNLLRDEEGQVRGVIIIMDHLTGEDN